MSGTTLIGASVSLSEGEVTVLREEALNLMQIFAAERLRRFHPDRCEGTPEEARQRETEQMIGAAEVFGACRNVELCFSTAEGLPEPEESAEVEFTERALAWMQDLRSDVRDGLEKGRRTVEVNIERTLRETFLLFVLDGIAAATAEGSAEEVMV
jgi:hypothetical protein